MPENIGGNVRLNEGLGVHWDAILGVATTRESCIAIEAIQAKIAELEALAYIGEHHFPDLTWKVRCDELIQTIEALNETNSQLAHQLWCLENPE